MLKRKAIVVTSSVVLILLTSLIYLGLNMNGGTERGLNRVGVPKAGKLGKSDDELLQISKQGCLSLTLAEMKTIQEQYAELQREPK